MGLQASLGGDNDFIADRDIASQLGIIDVADANVVAALLDRGVGFDALDPRLDIATIAKPVHRCPDPCRHQDPIGGAGANVDTARTRRNVEVDRSGHAQRPFEGSFIDRCRRQRQKTHHDQSSARLQNLPRHL